MAGKSPASDGQVPGQIRAESESETESLKASPKGKKPELRLPADWVPTAAHYERAKANRIDIAVQVEAFKLHAETHDRHAANWNAAFTSWLIKAKPSPKGGGSDWALRL